MRFTQNSDYSFLQDKIFTNKDFNGADFYCCLIPNDFRDQLPDKRIFSRQIIAFI